MTEYYQFIAEAVAKLETSTFDARQQLYERARGALMTKLGRRVHGYELACERRALDAAIQRVEEESVAPNCTDVVRQNCVEVKSVCLPSTTVSSQITIIEPKSLQIASSEEELPRIIPVGETKSLLPAETASAIQEQYRQRAIMLRAIGTLRCLELATHCEEMANAIETGRMDP